MNYKKFFPKSLTFTLAIITIYMSVSYIKDTNGQAHWTSSQKDTYEEEEHNSSEYSFAGYSYYYKPQFDGHYSSGYFYSSNNYDYKAQFEALRGDL